MVSLFGRGFDSLQLHFVAPSRGLTLVRVLSPLRFESVSLRRRARAPNGSQKASHYEMLFAFIKDIISGVIILIIQISFTQTVSLTIRNIVITLLRDSETPVVISRHRATAPPCPQSSPPHGGAGGEAPISPSVVPPTAYP